MSSVLIAAAIVVGAVAIALIVKRRRPDPPTQAAGVVPTQVDRADFVRPEAPWLVAVFTSATCHTCADVAAKAEVLASDDVAVAEVSYDSAREIHRRYRIDAVPTLLLADADGVVRATALGPVAAQDLWSMVADARAADGG
ncbi:MAG: thioredoxin family protein [Ilumatobacteraceae bacterium]